MDAPRAPSSTAGLDGVATRVSPTTWTLDLAQRLTAEERAAERAAELTVTRRATAAEPEPVEAPASGEPVALEVSAPQRPEPGLLESIVGAVLGFLFG
jgi:hypothetical protein